MFLRCDIAIYVSVNCDMCAAPPPPSALETLSSMVLSGREIFTKERVSAIPCKDLGGGIHGRISVLLSEKACILRKLADLPFPTNAKKIGLLNQNH